MFKSNKITAGIVAYLLTISAAHSAIIGIETISTAEAIIDRTSFEGTEIVNTFEGEQISEIFGSAGFGAAYVFESTSGINDQGNYEWQNGSASFGDGITSVSRTEVGITIQNDTDERLLPTLNSEILAGGFGMYSSGCDASDLRLCETGEDSLFTLLNGGVGVPFLGTVASTSFNFVIMSGNEILFELSGGFSLINEGEGGNEFTTNFSDAENFLNNFRLTSTEDNPRERTYDWDTTELAVTLTELAPGELSTITYITEVTTFSDSLCVFVEAAVTALDEAEFDCLMSYGSFGDPVGRGGGARPRITGLTFESFELDKPTFQDGELTLKLDNPNKNVSVSSPATAGLVLLGAGLLSMRLRRK